MRYIIIALAFFMFSCQTSPNREDYPCPECYMAADLVFRMQEAPDKSSIVSAITACTDAMKEKRYLDRMKYCTKSTPDGMTNRECMAILNQK